jgi:hypothetical protein
MIGSETKDESKLSITRCPNAVTAAFVDPHSDKMVHADLILDR